LGHINEKSEQKRKKSKISGKIGKFGLKKVTVREQNAKKYFFLDNVEIFKLHEFFQIFPDFYQNEFGGP
jgi:hypothetical protein